MRFVLSSTKVSHVTTAAILPAKTAAFIAKPATTPFAMNAWVIAAVAIPHYVKAA